MGPALLFPRTHRRAGATDNPPDRRRSLARAGVAFARRLHVQVLSTPARGTALEALALGCESQSQLHRCERSGQCPAVARLRTPRNRRGALVRFALSCAPRLRAGSAAGVLGTRRAGALPAPAVAIVGSRVATEDALGGCRAAGVGTGRARRHGGERAGAGRGFGGSPRCLSGAAAPRWPSWAAGRIGFTRPSTRKLLRVSVSKGHWSASSGPGAPRCPSIFRSGTASSAGSRWPW